MDPFVLALLTGSATGAVVAGIFAMLKPLVDYGILVLTERRAEGAQRQAVVKDLVSAIRVLRVNLVESRKNKQSMSTSLILETSDAALLIHDRDFARYLSLDIENLLGFDSLSHWHEQNGELEPYQSVSDASYSARWGHLKTLVQRASEYAVTGEWDRSWVDEANRLRKEIATAEADLFDW